MKLKNPSGCKKIRVQAHEKLRIFLEDFGAGSRAFNLEIIMEGPAAICEVRGRMQAFANDEKKWTVRQIFLQENQQGMICLKGAAENKSRIKFDGGAVIESTSRKAQVRVSERVILFDQAKAVAVPVLTVKTNDVKKVSHAAAIAPVEEEKIFYCAARGLRKKKAIKILKKGFLK